MTPDDPLDRLTAEETDRLVDSWGTPGTGCSEHIRLEIAHAVHSGHRLGKSPPLDAAVPVPGCSCLRCLLLSRGASREEVHWAKEVVHDLSRLVPQTRLRVALRVKEVWRGGGLNFPSAGWLCRRAQEVAGAVESDRPAAGDRDPTLPVEAARSASILTVAQQAGLEPKRRGREWAACCPFHDDADPSLHLNEEKRVFHCFGCGASGDVIDFRRKLDGTPFPEAVRALAGAGP